MYYFVEALNGQRYGPADIDTLVVWVAQGRVAPETTLIERGTERRCRADSIDALAAAFRRGSGASQAVVVERGGVIAGQYPTLTQGPGGVGTKPPAVPMQLFPNAPGDRPVGSKSKFVAGLLGIFLPFGVHRFYLGYVGMGVLQVLATFFCGVGVLWCFVEGIICLCGGMQDADGYELRD